MQNLIIPFFIITIHFLTPQLAYTQLELNHDKETGRILVYKSEGSSPTLTQNAYSK